MPNSKPGVETSHKKSPCDGIGDTEKQLTANALCKCFIKIDSDYFFHWFRFALFLKYEWNLIKFPSNLWKEKGEASCGPKPMIND